MPAGSACPRPRTGPGSSWSAPGRPPWPAAPGRASRASAAGPKRSAHFDAMPSGHLHHHRQRRRVAAAVVAAAVAALLSPLLIVRIITIHGCVGGSRRGRRPLAILPLRPRQRGLEALHRLPRRVAHAAPPKPFSQSRPRRGARAAATPPQAPSSFSTRFSTRVARRGSSRSPRRRRRRRRCCRRFRSHVGRRRRLSLRRWLWTC